MCYKHTESPVDVDAPDNNSSATLTPEACTRKHNIQYILSKIHTDSANMPTANRAALVFR